MDKQQTSSSQAPGRTATIVVAAGSSVRFGRPKLLERIGDQSVLSCSISTALRVADEVVVVCSDAVRDVVLAEFPSVRVVSGGVTRTDSVARGLWGMSDMHNIDVVLIHDGARPCASPELFARVRDKVRSGAEAVVPALMVTETLKRTGVIDGERVVLHTIERDEVVSVQTPQGFRRDVLVRAMKHADERGEHATDDAGLVERIGVRVAVIPGETANRKITTTDDLDLIQDAIQRRDNAKGQE